MNHVHEFTNMHLLSNSTFFANEYVYFLSDSRSFNKINKMFTVTSFEVTLSKLSIRNAHTHICEQIEPSFSKITMHEV